MMEPVNDILESLTYRDPRAGLFGVRVECDLLGSFLWFKDFAEFQIGISMQLVVLDRNNKIATKSLVRTNRKLLATGVVESRLYNRERACESVCAMLERVSDDSVYITYLKSFDELAYGNDEKALATRHSFRWYYYRDEPEGEDEPIQEFEEEAFIEFIGGCIEP